MKKIAISILLSIALLIVFLSVYVFVGFSVGLGANDVYVAIGWILFIVLAIGHIYTVYYFLRKWEYQIKIIVLNLVLTLLVYILIILWYS